MWIKPPASTPMGHRERVFCVSMEKNDAKKIEGKNAPIHSSWSALALAWQLGYSIAIPLVVLALAGRIADKKFGTSPWLLLTGVMLSLVISTIAVYRKTIVLMGDIREQKEEKEKE